MRVFIRPLVGWFKRGLLWVVCAGLFPLSAAGETLEVGVAWQGKALMPNRVLAGMKNALAENAPQIQLDIRSDLPDLEALEAAITEFEATKQAMVILRSNGAELLGQRGAAIPAFIGGANNPVELGAAYALDKPKPNITGVTYYLPIRLKLESFRQIYPDLNNLLLLVEAGHPGSVIDVNETEVAATEFAMGFRAVHCHTLDEALDAVHDAAPDKTIVLGVQALLMDNVKAIMQAAGDRIVFSYSEQGVDQGALAAVAADDDYLGRALGMMLIDHLVHGIPVSEMPIQTDPDPRVRLHYRTLERFANRIPFAVRSLARSEQILDSILKSAPTGIGVVEDRMLVRVNDYILDLTGYSREELIGQDARILYPTQADYDYVGTKKYRQLAEYGVGRVETRWRHKDGSIRYVILSSTPIDPADLDAGVTFTALDITDRKRAEAALITRTLWFLAGSAVFIVILLVLVARLAKSLRQRRAAVNALRKNEERLVEINQVLRESEKKLSTLFTAMTEIVVLHELVFDDHSRPVDYRITDVNEAFSKVLGIPRDKAVGHLATEVYAAPAAPYLEEFARVAQTGEPHQFITYYEPMDRHFAISVVSPGKNKFATVTTDVTKQKRAEEERLVLERQMLHAQKLESLGVLAGGIAHDFNNLLMTILGNADLALDALSPMSPARDNLMEVERATRRAADLAKQMLAYSGKGRFLIEPIDAGKLVEEMAHLLKVSVSKRIVFKSNFSKNLPTFEGDATQIRQIILNLVTNASEAIGEKSGVIALSTGALYCDRAYLDQVDDMTRPAIEEPLAEGLYVYFEVADTGCGMNAETLEKIFDPFFTTKFTGRGLGMSAVLGILRGHKGAIKIHSKQGKGTTFKVFFPAGKTLHVEEVSVPSEEKGDATWRGEGTVLIADDDESVRAVDRQMIERLGFRVLTALDGEEAVEVFRRNANDIVCVLLDLTLPNMDGKAVFKALRRIRPRVAVLLTSGYNEQEAIQRFSGEGLAGFIQKPYTLHALRDKLREVISK